jgi:hypothetical protein
MRYAIIALGAIGVIVGAVIIVMQPVQQIGMLALPAIIVGIGVALAGVKLRTQ